MTNTLSKFIGNRAFYKRALTIAVPIMIQNGITNFVGMLDNIMVGRVGQGPMSAVAIVNTLLTIYNLCIFGGVAGAGIYTAQYYGEKNDEGLRHTIRYKLWIGAILTALAIAVFLTFGESLISSYLKGSTNPADMASTLRHGKIYMEIMMLGFPAFALLQVYTSTLRECDETVFPMKAGIIAICVNLLLNYLLIFGNFGCPKLGVAGAAIATVVSRYVEAAIVVIWTHKHKDRNSYIKGVYRTLKIPVDLFKKMFFKGLPILINETLWSGGMAILTQCYSMRGINVVAALSIANTIYMTLNVGFIALGDAIAIIVGQLLGAGKLEEARETDTKLIAFSIFISTGLGLILFALAFVFPNFYNASPEAKHIATQFIIVQAIFMPQVAFVHTTYFTLRSGGKTLITFIFDSAYMWLINVTVAYLLSHFTGISAITMFVIVQITDWGKCILGFILVKKGIWIQNLTT